MRGHREKLEELDQKLHALWNAYATGEISFQYMLDREEAILEDIQFHKSKIKEKIYKDEGIKV